MSYHFYNFEDNWSVEKQDNIYYLNNTFKYQVGVRNYPEEDSAVLRIALSINKRMIIFIQGQRTHDETLQKEVLKALDESRVYIEAFELAKRFRTIGENNMVFKEGKALYSRETKFGKQYYCLFEADGFDGNFQVILKNKEVIHCKITSKNLQRDYILRYVFDKQLLIDYFYTKSKERVKLLY